MRFYQELAEWWPLFSPPVHYIEEVDDFLRRLAPLAPGPKTMLELGSGGGSFASHLKPHFTLTLTDISEGMLTESRALNPDAEHIAGDGLHLEAAARPDVVRVDRKVEVLHPLGDGGTGRRLRRFAKEDAATQRSAPTRP